MNQRTIRRMREYLYALILVALILFSDALTGEADAPGAEIPLRSVQYVKHP